MTDHLLQSSKSLNLIALQICTSENRMSQVLFRNLKMLAIKLFLFCLTLKHKEDNIKELMWCMEPTMYKIIWIRHLPPLGKKICDDTTLVCGNFYLNKAVSKSQQQSNCSVFLSWPWDTVVKSFTFITGYKTPKKLFEIEYRSLALRLQIFFSLASLSNYFKNLILFDHW